MRTVHELRSEELEELRQRYFYELLDTDEQDMFDDVGEIPIENVIQHFEGIFFVDEDFFCNE